MKKVILFFSVILLSIVSCSTNEDPIVTPDPEIINPDPVIPTSFILPKKIINLTDNVVKSTANIIYNGNKIIEGTTVKSNGTTKDVFTYTGDLITKIEVISGGVIKYSNEFQYDSNTRLSVELSDDEFFENSVAVRRKTKKVFTYNPDGTVLETNFKLVNSIYENTGTTSVYTLANGNEIKKVTNGSYSYPSGINGEISTTNTITTVVKEYDTKINPLKNILGFEKLTLTSRYSVNNILKRTNSSTSTTNNIANPIMPANVANFNLIYNTNNYLSERKSTSTNTSTINGVTTTTTSNNSEQYFYE